MPSKLVEVFVPAGPINRNELKRRAIAQARADLPAVLSLDCKIAEAVRVSEPVRGTRYTMEIVYVERGTAGAAAEVSAALPAGVFGHTGADEDVDPIDAAVAELSVNPAAAVFEAKADRTA